MQPPPVFLGYDKNLPGKKNGYAYASDSMVEDDMLLDSCRVFEEENLARRDVVNTNELFSKNKVFNNL